jgi:hypothetical protein
MTVTARAAAPAALLLLFALTGCGGAGSGEQEEHIDDGVEGQPDDPIAADDCLVGDWLLDVADYGAQSEAYLTGLGIPITDFAMDGSGFLAFGADGTVGVSIGLTTTGVLHGDDVAVPISVPGEYTANGTWSRPDADVDAIDIDVATQETDAGDATAGEVSIPIPMLNFESNSRAFVICDGDSLTLQGADAPFGSLWTRTG